jgi:hypothetical protein
MMVFDHGSGDGGRALWMENVLSAGSAAGGATGGYSGAGAVQYGPTSLRSLPPYPNPPVPARYYPTYNTPWLVRVSWGGGGGLRLET